jgi:ABC-2 type transport system permease protein
MFAIYKKEINQFLSSLVGYVAIGMFLVLSALFTFVFPSTSVLDSGFASLDPFFSNAPLFFLFLIPAISMRMFSEEFSSGTIELLLTRPLKITQIIAGKYLAALTLVVFSIIPTFVYYFSISKIAAPIGNVDTGGIIGSYFGLILLGASFVAIGSFGSAISNNQIIAFLLSVLLCFLFYMGFDFISKLPVFAGKFDYFVEHLGIQAHYLSLSRGVIDTRDVIYFLSIILIFLLLSNMILSKRK